MKHNSIFKKSIGVFGGAGPWASSHAVMSMVHMAQWDYCAVEDTEYPEIILRSVPLRGFESTGIEDEDLVRDQLIEQFNRFAADDVEIVVMACNSIHSFHSELQERHPEMQILHLPKDGADVVSQQGHQKVGVLSSVSASNDNLHMIALQERNIEAVMPSNTQQDDINFLIRSVMGGNSGAKEAQVFRALSHEFEESGVSVLLSGCTELSYLSHKFETNLPTVDCLYASIKKALQISAAGPL